MSPLGGALRPEQDDLRHPMLKGHEGWRVEAEWADGDVARFIVGRTVGPSCMSLRMHNRRSSGGHPVSSIQQIVRVTRLYKMEGY
jgi:hypothetical protein